MDLNTIVQALVGLKEAIVTLSSAIISNATAIIGNSEAIEALHAGLLSFAQMTIGLFMEISQTLEMVGGIVMSNVNRLDALEVAVSQMGAQVDNLEKLVYGALALGGVNFVLLISLLFKRRKCCKVKGEKQ